MFKIHFLIDLKLCFNIRKILIIIKIYEILIFKIDFQYK